MTAITEYGVRRAHPVTGAERIQWPTPGTGLLALPGGTVDGTDLDGIWAAIKAQPSLEGASVVVRSYDVEEVPKPAPALPMTPGSVVRASLPLIGQRLLALSSQPLSNDDGVRGMLLPGSPKRWVNITPQLGEPYAVSLDEMDDVEILFDAGTAP